MSNEVALNGNKEVLSFTRIEFHPFLSPFILLSSGWLGFAAAEPGFGGLFAFAAYTASNLYMNFDDMFGESSMRPLSFVSCVPLAGALVKPEKRLKADAPYTFSKNASLSASNKESTLTDFLEQNNQTLNSWDEFFRTETGNDHYKYIDDNVKTNFFGEAFHAWVIEQIEKDFAYRGVVLVDKTPSGSGVIGKTGRGIFKKKVAKAKAKGEYVPIHWEYLAMAD